MGTPSSIAYTEPHLTPKSNTFAVSGASCWGVAGADKVRPQQHPKRKWNWEPPQALLTPTPSYAQDHIITAPRRAPPCPARRPRRRGRTFKYTYIHTYMKQHNLTQRCMHAYMYIYIYTNIHKNLHYILTHTDKQSNTHTHMHACMHAYAYMLMYAYIHICIDTLSLILLHMHIYIYIYCIDTHNMRMRKSHAHRVSAPPPNVFQQDAAKTLRGRSQDAARDGRAHRHVNVPMSSDKTRNTWSTTTLALLGGVLGNVG